MHNAHGLSKDNSNGQGVELLTGILHGLPTWGLGVVAGIPVWWSRAPGTSVSENKVKAASLRPSFVGSHGITSTLCFVQSSHKPAQIHQISRWGTVRSQWIRAYEMRHCCDNHWIIQCNIVCPPAITIHIPICGIHYTFPKISKVSVHYGIMTASDLIL